MYIVLSPCFLLFSTHTSAFILEIKKNHNLFNNESKFKRHFCLNLRIMSKIYLMDLNKLIFWKIFIFEF